jgi:hypothetical protein
LKGAASSLRAIQGAKLHGIAESVNAALLLERHVLSAATGNMTQGYGALNRNYGVP